MPPAKKPDKSAPKKTDAATKPAPRKRAAAKPAAPTEEQIAVRAYHIYESERNGDPVDHWLRAERELSTAATKPRAGKSKAQ